MVTKEILIQYSDLQEEIKEVRDRIEPKIRLKESKGKVLYAIR
jgi:hypothetical protein